MITIFYNNPENLNPDEIHRKLMNLYKSCIYAVGVTTNRDKRIKVLESYSTENISKDEFIKNFCNK